ncbi:MAG: RNA methyltransferase [Rhodospirillales bacterium]|nr:RNA methyltransferase [Rhodospirillales bacterium]
MSGTDRSRAGIEAGAAPAVILIEPQLPENIGMVARAMLNCGLTELRLVRPREIWPNDKAVAAASGADRVLDAARLYASTREAIADLAFVYATSARPRYMTKQVLTPRAAATDLHWRCADGQRCGLLFGREASGLDNDDVARANALITAPLNPAFSSLNLGMAVLLVGYEWYTAGEAAAAVPPAELVMPEQTRPASHADLAGLYDHLESELDTCGFLRNAQSRPSMVRNLRNFFGRATPSEQEVRTLRGVIACLTEARHARSGGGER